MEGGKKKVSVSFQKGVARSHFLPKDTHFLRKMTFLRGNFVNWVRGQYPLDTSMAVILSTILDHMGKLSVGLPTRTPITKNLIYTASLKHPAVNLFKRRPFQITHKGAFTSV